MTKGIKDYEHDDPGGAPSKYNPALHPELAEELISKTGASYSKLGKAFGVTKTTIFDWIAKHEDFSNAVFRGMAVWHSQDLIKPLQMRARGYRYTETRKETGSGPTGDMTKTVTTRKHIPPDVKALIFALTNYAPDRFSDKSEMKVDTPKLEINLNVPKREKE